MILSHRSYKSFRATGSALMLTVACCMSIASVFVIALTFLALSFVQNRLAVATENVSMLAAQSINAHDRVGQINNMVAAARQMVFNSRQTYIQAAAKHPEIAELSEQLLNESRAGARLVESEKQRRLSSTLGEIRSRTSSVAEKNIRTSLQLPWLICGQPTIADLNVGYVRGTETNVAAPVGNAELMALDAPYIDAKTNLYLGNISLPLPGADSDLSFELSSLAPPVIDTLAPARVLTNDSFQSILPLVKDGQPAIGYCKYFPSAVRITSCVELQNSLIGNTTQMAASTTAATNGACPMP